MEWPLWEKKWKWPILPTTKWIHNVQVRWLIQHMCIFSVYALYYTRYSIETIKIIHGYEGHAVEVVHTSWFIPTELLVYPRYFLQLCCTSCGRMVRWLLWTTLLRNTWRILPLRTHWEGQKTLTPSPKPMDLSTPWKGEPAPPQSPCAGWPASSLVRNS